MMEKAGEFNPLSRANGEIERASFRTGLRFDFVAMGQNMGYAIAADDFMAGITRNAFRPVAPENHTLLHVDDADSCGQTFENAPANLPILKFLHCVEEGASKLLVARPTSSSVVLMCTEPRVLQHGGALDLFIGGTKNYFKREKHPGLSEKPQKVFLFNQIHVWHFGGSEWHGRAIGRLESLFYFHCEQFWGRAARVPWTRKSPGHSSFGPGAFRTLRFRLGKNGYSLYLWIPALFRFSSLVFTSGHSVSRMLK
jgi:hypothetical protein